jgi:hypothetical protein
MNERINGRCTRRALWNAYDYLRELHAQKQVESNHPGPEHPARDDGGAPQNAVEQPAQTPIREQA